MSSPSSHTILNNCNIVDVETGSIIRSAQITIENGLIKKITESKTKVGGEVVDMGDEFVLPGLFNVHCHLSARYPFNSQDPTEPAAMPAIRAYRRAYDALHAGITTLRSCGELHRVDLPLRDMIRDEWLVGPRILAGGKGLGVTGGHGTSFYQVEADGADEFRKAARAELEYGADHIKIMLTGGVAGITESLEEPQMTREEVEAVVSVAKSKRTYVAAHSGGSEPTIMAAEAGVRCFEHGYVLNRAAANAIKSVGGFLVPTLVVTRSEGWQREQGDKEWVIEKSISAGPRHLESIKYAINEGVKLVTGTDHPPAALKEGVVDTVREMEWLHEVGLTPLDTIRSSTATASELCGVNSFVGLVKERYVADLIAVPANPLEDLSAMRQIRFVLKDGKLMKSGGQIVNHYSTPRSK